MYGDSWQQLLLTTRSTIASHHNWTAHWCLTVLQWEDGGMCVRELGSLAAAVVMLLLCDCMWIRRETELFELESGSLCYLCCSTLEDCCLPNRTLRRKLFLGWLSRDCDIATPTEDKTSHASSYQPIIALPERNTKPKCSIHCIYHPPNSKASPRLCFNGSPLCCLICVDLG